MEIEQDRGLLGQFGRRGQPTVQVGTTPAGCRHDPGQDDLFTVGVLEPPLDPRLLRAVAHHTRIGALAREERQRAGDQGLPGTGLTGDRGQAGTDDEMQLVDDSQIRDAEFLQHQRSAKPNFALRIWWKSRGPA